MSLFANTSFARIIARNFGTLQQDPTPEDLEDFNVIKYGPAIIATDLPKHQHVNPSRYIFLRHGVIGYCAKGKFSPQEALQNTIENQRSNKRTFYLSPSSTVERLGPTIILTAAVTKEADVSWVATTQQIGLDKIRFTFASVALAEEWEKAFKEMLGFRPLTRGCVSDYQTEDTDFPRRFNELMWQVMLSTDNLSLMNFYLDNLVNKVTEERGVVEREGARSCAQIFEFLYRNLKDMMGGKLVQPHEELLAFAVTKLCTSDAVERAFLLLCAITPEAFDYALSNEAQWVSKCHDGANAAVSARSNLEPPVRVLNILLASISQNPSVRKALLLALGHPAASRLAGGSEGAVDWAEEASWFRDLLEKRTASLSLKPADMDLFVQSASWFPYRWLDELLRGLKSKGSSTEPNNILDMLKVLPDSVVVSTFEFQIKGSVISSQHFIDILISMPPVVRKVYIKHLFDRGLATNAMLGQLIREGLRTEQVQDLHDCLVTLLFKSGRIVDDFDASVGGTLNATPVVILDALAAINTADSDGKKKIRSQTLHKDFCRFLLLLAIRFEQCDTRRIIGMTTISNRLRSKLNGKAEEEEKIAALLKELKLAAFAYKSFVEPLLGSFYPSTGETEDGDDDDFDFCDDDEDRDDADIDSDEEPGESFRPMAHTFTGLQRKKSQSRVGNTTAESNVLSKESLEHLILGLFSVCIWSNAAFHEFCYLFPNRGMRMFSSVLAPDYPLRDQFIEILQEKTEASSAVIGLMRRNVLLNDPRHFRPEAIELFSLSSKASNQSMFADLLGVALKLRVYDGLKERVDAFTKSLMVSSQTKIPIFGEIVAAVEKHSAEEMADVSLEDLKTCINNAVTALSSSTGPAQTAKYELLCKYLRKESPSSWSGLFASIPFDDQDLAKKPSAEDLVRYGVVKHGQAIVLLEKAQQQRTNPPKNIFLRHGVLGCSLRTNISPNQALKEVLENQEIGSGTLYLSPGSSVERSGPTIALTASTTKLANVKWVDATQPNLGQSKIRLTFSSDDLAEEWEKAFKNMLEFQALTRSCVSNYLTEDMDFPRSFNEMMWHVMLHTDNLSLMNFYLDNLVDKVTEDSGVVDCEGPYSCVQMFEFLYRNLREMMGGKLVQPHEELLAFAVTKLCTSDAVERAFLLLCAITPEAFGHALSNEAQWVSKCHDGANAAVSARSNLEPPVRVLNILLASISQNPSVRKALLLALGHPAASRGLVNWAEEAVWFRDLLETRRDAPLVLSSTDIDLIIRSPLWLVYRLLDDLLTKFDGSVDGNAVCLILSALPQSFVLSKFEFEIKGKVVFGEHLLDIVFSMTQEIRKEYLRAIRNRGLANNSFLEGLMSGGLRVERARELYECIVALFFDSDSVLDDFDSSSIGCVSEAPVIICDAILRLNVLDDMKQKKIHSTSLDKDFCKFMFLLAVRLEYCENRGMSGVMTITRRIRRKALVKAEEEKKEVASMIGELDMTSFVYKTFVEPVFDDFYPGDDDDDTSLLEVGKRRDVRRVGARMRGRSNVDYSDVYDDDDDYDFTLRPTDSSAYSGTSSPKRSLARQSSVSQRTTLSKESLEHILLGLFSIGVWCNSHIFIDLTKRFPNNGKRVFSSFLAPDYPLRAEFIEIVRERTLASPAVVALMRENILLNDVRHFEPAAMELLSLSTTTSNPRLFADILGVALKLRNYSNLKERVDSLMKSLMVSSQSKLLLLREIIAEVEKRSVEEMGTVSLEDLNSCIGNGVTALALLSGAAQAVQHDQMFQMLCLYLHKEKPPSWYGLFKGAHTIAIFIKYMTREDFAKAYAMFNDLNEDNPELIGILRTVRRIYASPVVSPEEVKNIMENGTSPEAVEGFLAMILEKSTSMDAEGKFIIKTSVDWMRYMYKRINIPMAPRNSQLITMMTCVTWVRSIVSGSSASGSRALISQVGTGEGKSLIIAMSAIYLVKMLGMKVHVLENNSSLLEKDFAQFKTFYEEQGVTCCTRFSDPEANVTYCLRCDPEGKKDMEAFYRDSVYSGKEPFKKTVLIVDEVDELIVDGDPNVCYIKNVTGSGTQLKAAYDALRAGSGRPAGVDDEIWSVASRAYKNSQSKVEGKDYVTSGSNVYLLTDGVIAKRSVTPWLNCLRYLAGGSSNIGIQSTFFVQSMPHMMSQYECILGLSGSLGSASEREFLKQTYSAIAMRTPPFLDTCKGITKQPPVLIGGSVQVHPTASKQVEAIIDLAIEKFQVVPVLIITKSREESQQLHRTIVSQLEKRKYQPLLGGAPAEDFVQMFAQFNPVTLAEMDYPSIIEKATAQLDLGVKTRRITVTDPFGGRGHDFALYDEQADAHGGMVVIATNIPPSERDWTQWKGRTARSDRKGQYAVILCKEDEPLKSLDKALFDSMYQSGVFYQDGLIRALLDVRDRETGAAIAEKGTEILGGQRVSELCDRFYLQYQRDDDAPWYSGSHDKQLSKFLEKGFSNFTKSAVDDFKTQVHVAYASKYR